MILDYLPYKFLISISHISKAFLQNVFSPVVPRTIKFKAKDKRLGILLQRLNRVLGRLSPDAIGSIDFSEVEIEVL